MKKAVFFLWLAALACGQRPSLEKAQKLERQKLFTKAIDAYAQFVQAHPKAARVPEALWRQGEIFRREFQVYSEAKEAYQKILSEHPDSQPWAAQARLGLMRCPDYFPMHAGCSWVEGDSDTLGRNMRAEVRVSSAASAAESCLEKTIYAGQTLFSKSEQCYHKENEELKQVPSQTASGTILLRYPCKAGKTWSGLGNRPAAYSIEKDNVTVKVKAGTFSGCLQVKEQLPGLRSWSYTYYAPNVGKILTSVSTSKGEKRVAELLSYSIAKEEP